MAWSNSKGVGNWGSQLIVDVTLNSQSGNSSNITVRIRLRNGGSSTAFDNNGTSWTMSNGVSASGSDTFSIGAGATGTLASRSFNVAHNANGTKSLTVTINVGNTSTSTFGTPGSLSVSFSLPRIPKAPSKPGKPTISNVTATGLRGRLASAPADNGAGINAYGWETDKGQSVTLTSGGRTWDLAGLSANTAYRVRIRARNSVGWGPWSDWSATATTKPQGPNAPSNVTASRVNDSRQTIGWSRNATTARPYTSQRVQRNYWTGSARSAWVTIATLSGTATSYTDTTTSANNDYRYRVQAINSAGSAVSAESNRVRTTPAAPTNVSAKKSGNNIVVSFTQSTPWDGETVNLVEDNPGGTGWVQVGTTSSRSSFTHSNPNPAVTHRYRVRTRDSLVTTLTGPYSGLSNTVQLIAAPNAPTLGAPTGTIDRDADITFRWTHNPVDTTDQSAYELRYRVNGGSWTTLTGTTATSRTVSALGVSGAVEWQARTKGEHANFSPWAAVKSFTLASKPTVAINEPEGPVLDVSTVELTWGYDNDDTSGQTQWQAELLDSNDDLIEQRSGSGATSSTLFRTALTDGQTYTVRVRVRSGAGLWSDWDDVTFETNFPAPAKVVVSPEWDRETGAVTLTFEVTEPEGDETEPESVDVQRDDGDGWVTIAVELDPETSIIDYTPRLGEVRYRAISRTSLPSAQVGDETVIEWAHGGRDPVFVNGGTDFENVCAAVGHEVSDSPGIEQAAHEWAGWNKPTAVFGEGQSYAVQFQANIFPHIPNLDGRSTREEWHDLLLQRGIVCYRDCAGRKIFGLLGINFQTASSVTRLALTVEETHFDEGVAEVLPVPDEGDN